MMKHAFKVLWLLLLCCLPCRAEKYALLIGIDEYENKDAIATLSAAAADARALGKALKDVGGFPADNVRLLASDAESKPTRNNILYEIELLTRQAKPGDLVFVSYCGHGTDLGNDSFLLPYDVDPRSEFLLRRSAIPTRDFTEALGALPQVNLVLAFDMCRTNPFKAGDRAATSPVLTNQQARDLVLKPAQEGAGVRASITLFACSVGERSWEWRDKKRGFFSYYLEQGLRNGPGRIRDLVDYLETSVPLAVQRETNQQQTPWSKTEGTGALGLVLGRGTQSTLPPAIAPEAPIEPTIENLTTLATLQVTTTPAGAKVFVDDVEQNGAAPCNIEIDLGRQRTKTVEVAVELNGYKPALRRVNITRGATAPLSIDLEKLPVPKVRPPQTVAPTVPDAATPTIGSTRINAKDGAEMVWVPAGEFIMGSNEDADEKPQRRVYLDGYWIYKTEVTVAQYRRFCDATGRAMAKAPDWGWKDDHPVVNVSWDDAQAYSAWAGVGLPTEAQWEKAARGVDGRVYPWGNEFDTNRLQASKGDFGDAKSPMNVGFFRSGASPYGCLDMAGNVREWCADWYHESYYANAPERNPTGPTSGQYRVLRGSFWYFYHPFNFRSAYRNNNAPGSRNQDNGFRCVQGRR